VLFTEGTEKLRNLNLGIINKIQLIEIDFFYQPAFYPLLNRKEDPGKKRGGYYQLW